VVRPVASEDLLDDLAYQIHEYLLEQAVQFSGENLTFIPITEIVKKFGKNHRTIDRRLAVLKNVGLLQLLVKKTYGSLFWVKEELEEED
jgi:hypothetical protein